MLHFDALTLCNRIGRGGSIAGDRHGADVMVDVFEEEGRTSAARLGVCVNVVGRGEGSERTEGEDASKGRHFDCGMIRVCNCSLDRRVVQSVGELVGCYTLDARGAAAFMR